MSAACARLDRGHGRPTQAWLHFLRFKIFLTASFESIKQKALDLALHSVRLDPKDYRAHWVLGGLYLYQRKHARSMAEFDRALRINPNDANLLANSADSLIYCRRTEEAVERCERAIRHCQTKNLAIFQSPNGCWNSQVFCAVHRKPGITNTT